MTAKRPSDITVKKISLFLIPVDTRMPLKFGSETLTSVTCARACVTVEDRQGNIAQGWGETPLSVQWAWPSPTSYSERHEVLIDFLKILVKQWIEFDSFGHPIELTHQFQSEIFHPLIDDLNAKRKDSATAKLPAKRHQHSPVSVSSSGEPFPYLAGLVAASVIDQAIHDAYGVLHRVDCYDTYNSQFMSQDLSHFLDPAKDSGQPFAGRYPVDYLVGNAPTRLPVWHLVGGLDPLAPADRIGDEPDDGYPVVLEDWIRRDRLNCLKIKLRGSDHRWDYQRLIAVGTIAANQDVQWLSADFNCTVGQPEYVNEILDRLRQEHPSTFQKILYVEQPFPYDLEKHLIDVRSVSHRKPLFLDESAHDWKYVRLGRALGWSGVALKTCKTQTGALLSLCWAKAHEMPLMVQDLTNPMLAQIPHVRLAAHAGTIMGVESNAMQFYPDASRPEQVVHPGLYQRRDGVLDLSTIQGSGFGYRVDEINRKLGQPLVSAGE